MAVQQIRDDPSWKKSNGKIFIGAFDFKKLTYWITINNNNIRLYAFEGNCLNYKVDGISNILDSLREELEPEEYLEIQKFCFERL